MLTKQLVSEVMNTNGICITSVTKLRLLLVSVLCEKVFSDPKISQKFLSTEGYLLEVII